MKHDPALHNILLIINTPPDIDGIEKALYDLNYEMNIIKAKNALHGLELLNAKKIDAIFMDYDSPGSERNFFDELKLRKVNTPVIAMIDRGRELNAAEAIKCGAYDYLIKESNYKDLIPGLIESIRNISDQKKETEEERNLQARVFRQIFRSQKWWQNIIDAIKDYLFVLDNNYRILRTNKAFANLFNKEPADIILKPYYELYGLDSPHEWCLNSEEMTDIQPGAVEREIEGDIYLISSFPINYDGNMAVVYIMKEITETRRLKDQVNHMEKLSSIGTFASGVAHEINNPLTGIIGYTEMLIMDRKNEGSKKYLQKVYDSAIRCKRIVENMLTFSRQASANKSPENINEILDKTIDMYEYRLKSTNIEIIRDYDKVPYINIDRQQMLQVVLNLLINAEHAISETGRQGSISLSTVCDKGSNQIIVTVSDNGCGIPGDILPRIFDPFYTTKPVNKGTGLGLSIAHGIIAEQGGAVEVKSEIDKGTSLIIRLPV